MLLALFLITGLCSCGGKDGKQEKPSSSPSVTEKAEDKTSDAKEEDSKDGIVLPEDGKIEFGKDNKKQEDKKDNQPPEQPKENTNDNSKNENPSEAEKQDYGNVTWN